MRSCPPDRAHRTRASAIPCVALAVCAALTVPPPTASAQETACADVGAVAGALPPAAAEAAVTCLVNGVRARAGLAQLAGSGRLTAAARRYAGDMVAHRFFAHVSPTGERLDQRIRRAGYLRSALRWVLGEDIAWGAPQATPAAIVDAWMNSPPHRRVILRPGFREVGVGVATGVPVADPGAGITFVLDVGRRVMMR
jgi:uncharacterized protein YkwD